MADQVTVVGAGLAGVEAAWQLVRRNIPVHLIEMRPVAMTPAHETDQFAELVCSNSLRADTLSHAAGLLKEEMRRFDSLIVSAADEHKVPAGSALAVDRNLFSRAVTERLSEHPNITISRREQQHIPAGLSVIASGPLTSSALSSAIGEFIGSDYLYFFDAIAPIVYADSINWDHAYWGSRYQTGTDDYVNCPLTEEQYKVLWQELTTADRFPLKEFERDKRLFEGCLPIEEMARRGLNTMRFGPLRPVGLIDPVSDRNAFAVVQLRRENAAGTLLNMVGFQTNLMHSEQKRVFSLIPALEQARFVRYGAMHRNTFINAPTAIRPTLQSMQRDDLLFAGQITGVEGYIESAATGLIAGINAALLYEDNQPIVFPPETAHGALCRYITEADPERFQPMNINFGLFDVRAGLKKREERVAYIVDRALAAVAELADGALPQSEDYRR